MKKLAAVSVALMGAVACSGVGEKVDTSKIIPVDDIYARDTAPTPPPPRMSTLSLMDSVPSGGICSVKRYRRGAGHAREVFYETSSPPRTYVLEIGWPPRQFGPASMDIRGTRNSDGLTETENVYVGFSASGAVTGGTRRYAASGTMTVNDREALHVGDAEKAIAFATKIVGLCDTQ